MKAVKRAIILCWIMLIVCFIIKLFGGNWFEIICNNEHFVYVCNYLDKHLIPNYAIAFVLYISSTYLVVCACCLTSKPNLKQFFLIIIVIFVVWATQFITMTVKSILEIIMFLLLPFFVSCLSIGFNNWKTALKGNWYKGIIGYVLVLLFQLLSLITKNIGIKITDSSTLITFILMIDYYIMVMLYYLYVLLKTKKEKNKNG